MAELDTSIPLQVKPQWNPAANAPPAEGGLQQMQRLLSIQQSLNQNQLFQQTFAARQKAGQIIAASPDLETAMKRLFADELTAPFAGEFGNAARQMMTAETQQKGMLQEQAVKGFNDWFKAVPGFIENPAMFDQLAGSYLKMVSPQVRDQVKGAMQSVRDGLLDGLPLEPEARASEMRRRFAGMATATGMSPETFSIAAGKPIMQELEGRTQPGVLSSTGEGFKLTGPALQHSLKPQITNIEGVPVPVGGTSGMPGVQGTVAGSGNPLAASQAPIAGNGKPIVITDDMISPAAAPKAGILGLDVLSPAQKDQAHKLNETFNTDELKSYQMANQSMASLAYMNNALDKMVEGGGFLIPGSMAQARTEVAKAANTFMQAIGAKETPFDADKLATIEGFNKETKRMGLMVINQFLGGQREAAQIITGITQSVPGIENTYLGGKLVAASLQAASQRVIDEREFKNLWQAKNQGRLNGATEAFNRQFPADSYAQATLQKFGMTPKGFESPEAIGRALQQGLLDKPQAEKYLKSQFNFQ